MFEGPLHGPQCTTGNKLADIIRVGTLSILFTELMHVVWYVIDDNSSHV